MSSSVGLSRDACGMSAARPEPVSSHTRITEQKTRMTEATRIIIYLFSSS
jgi:hypothetical protein